MIDDRSSQRLLSIKVRKSGSIFILLQYRFHIVFLLPGMGLFIINNSAGEIRLLFHAANVNSYKILLKERIHNKDRYSRHHSHGRSQ